MGHASKRPLLNRLNSIRSRTEQRRDYLRIFTFCAFMVALTTAAIMMRSGIAITYTEQVLDCHYTGVAAHHHDQACYDAEGNLLCPLPERELHEHDESCYDEEGNLVCGKEEILEEHVHGPGCFVTVTSYEGDDAPDADDESLTDGASGADAATDGSEDASKDTAVDEVLYPEQSFTHRFTTDDDQVVLRVDVQAPAGALPENSSMQASWIEPDKLSTKEMDAITQAVAEKTEGKMTDLQAIDITFKDAEGKEIEPASKITVTFTSDLVNTNDKPLVVHVDDLTEKQERAMARGKKEPERTAAVVDSLDEVELEQRDMNLGVDQLAFENDAFSTYVLAITTLDKIMEASDGSRYAVTVEAPARAGISQDAELEVSELMEGDDLHAEYLSQIADALGEDSGSVHLFDIGIVSGGQRVQPAEPVYVHIQLLDGSEPSETTKAVHFGKEGIEIIDATVTDGVVNFEASGFSVYAVVEEGSTANEARATVNFYGKDTSTPVATVYVKNSDVVLGDGTREPDVQYIEDIVYDPGPGTLADKELFDGWSLSTINTTDGSTYELDGESLTIEDIWAYLEGLEIHEGDVVNIYARIVKAYTVSYVGEDPNTVVGMSIVKVLDTDDVGEHTVSMNYTPGSSEQAFMGWLVSQGAGNIQEASYNGTAASEPYQNGTTLKINGDITLSVDAPAGHWLVFDENGKGATYNAPQFVEDGDTTSEPATPMERTGYAFGGWYTDADCTAGNEFTFGNPLTENTTIYAKWTPVQTANYTVIVWKERMTDTYDENGGTGEGKEKNYDFAESFTFSGNVGDVINAVTNGTSRVTDGDDNATQYNNARVRGVTTNNNNVDKTIAYTGYHCAGYDTGVNIAAEGNSVVNIYYDRNTVTYTFYTYGTSSSGGNWYLCDPYGNPYNGQVLIYDGREYSRYTGTPRYGDGNRYYYQSGGGTLCDPSRVYELSWEFVPSSTSQWNVYQKSIGLYGEPLDWPTDTDIWWYENHTATAGTGTRMTYKSAFLPLDDDMTVEYWGSESSTGASIHFYTQDLDGSFSEKHMVSSGAGTFNINDKFTGFEAYQYRIDNGQWQNVGNLNENTGIYGSAVRYANRLDIRYKRQSNSITFMDGGYFTGTGNPVDETPQADAFRTTDAYFYEQDVSSYNKGGADYYEPPKKDGYTFAGWYADDACTVEYDFTTMPLSGITVYAKWIQNQYRVFLHPNVPETDTSLEWGSGSQEMTFRVSSGETVSTPTGTRNNYEMIGWYLDEACTKVFDSNDFLVNDTTVTTPYDKSVDFTDEMNKWGNIEGVGSNSDLTGYNGGDRFWITKKLDLYAKWRANLTGADGIGVKYDANGGTNAPTDSTLYLDNSDAVAQGATNPPDDTQLFLCWVMQKWDGEKYVDLEGEKYHVYPGDTFTVLKDNAQVIELPESTEENPVYQYTIQLRAEYAPKDEPTPTHLTWYANGGVGSDGTTIEYTNLNMQINEAVDIKPADTFERDGYEFIGWARIDASADDYELSERELTEDDLFLKYEDGAYYAQITEGSDDWSPVSQVAADERDPYHDLYAVWKKKTYTVTVVKEIVNGLATDLETPFAFTPSFTGLDDVAYSESFSLVGKTGGADVANGSSGTIHYDKTKTFADVPFDTVFSITETADENFYTTVRYSVTDADDEALNVSDVAIENGDPVTTKGNVVLTVTNTRRLQRIRVMKTDGVDGLGGAHFSVTIDGTDFELNSDEDGLLKNADFPNGIFTIPFGEYSLTETKAPDGYNALTEDVTITVDADRVGAYCGRQLEVTSPTEGAQYYTIYVPNNPGVELPNSGGMGTSLFSAMGTMLIVLGGSIYIARRRRVSSQNENR